MLDISGKASIDLKKFRKTLKSRVEDAASVISKSLSDHIVKEVKSRIPEGGGWLDLYRDAIQFVEVGPLRWAVLAKADVELTTVPADKSLLVFSETDFPVMLKWNPWPIDAIPAVTNGYRGKFVVKGASEGEVQARRAVVFDSMDEIRTIMSAQGARIEDFGIPKINGTVVADLAFLAKRLEHGLGGFPRAPHWTPVGMKVRDKKGTQALTEDVLKSFEAIMTKGL